MYSEIKSEYKPILGVWQTHDLDGWSWDYKLDDDGVLWDGNGNVIDNVDTIDICRYDEGVFLDYHLTLQNSKVTLIEDLKDKAYWEEKEAKEEKEYWKSLSLWGKVKCKFYRAKHHVRWWYILRFRRKWLAELMVAPIRTSINYAEIGRKILTVDPEKDPAKGFLVEYEKGLDK
jgi:hypothetical protein